MTAISREAIEAAADAYCQENWRDGEKNWKREMLAGIEATLTAALPHLLPQPTASDEERAREVANHSRVWWWLDDDDAPTPMELTLNLTATIRAEATLAATLAERERCALMCEQVGNDAPQEYESHMSHYESGFEAGTDACAAAIRRAE